VLGTAADTSNAAIALLPLAGIRLRVALAYAMRVVDQRLLANLQRDLVVRPGGDVETLLLH